MREFGELEPAVMHVVWSHEEPVTVRPIAEQLNESRPLSVLSEPAGPEAVAAAHPTWP